MTRSVNPPLTRSRAATSSSMTVGRTTTTPGSGPSEAKLTVIVPVYDEAATIDELRSEEHTSELQSH